MLNTIVRGAAILAVLAAALTPVFSDDDFPIVGTYTKDEACKGDNARREDLLVKITRQNVESSMASCTILNRRRDGRAFQVHLERPQRVAVRGDEHLPAERQVRHQRVVPVRRAIPTNLSDRP